MRDADISSSPDSLCSEQQALVEAVERQKETAALIASGTLPAHAAKKDHEAAVRREPLSPWMISRLSSRHFIAAARR